MIIQNELMDIETHSSTDTTRAWMFWVGLRGIMFCNDTISLRNESLGWGDVLLNRSLMISYKIDKIENKKVTSESL